jgi:two-component system NtrC family sensor kinase
MKARRDRALRSLRLILVACATLPAALFAYASWVNYKFAFDIADKNIGRSLDIATGHAQTVFQSIVVTMNSVEQITRGRSSESMRLEESEFNQRLREMRAAIPRHRIDLAFRCRRPPDCIIASDPGAFRP